MNRSIALPALVALVLFATPTASRADPVSSPAAPPEFELPDLDGRLHRLSDWRGDWVVVNYWATWCAPCRKEIPDLSRLHDERDDITVLGLAFEDTDVATFRTFLEEYPASYPILRVDVYAPPEDFGAPRALPTTYLIAPDGRLAETWIGPITGDTVRERVDRTDEPAS